MAQSFTKRLSVHWQDCDVAGIVYYPKFFDMINVVTEDWFKEALGTPYADLMREQHIGFPTVKVDCEFAKPCQYGEEVELSLSLAAIGRTSIVLEFVALAGEQPCLRATHTLVMMSRDSFSAVPLPPQLRAAMTPYLKAAAPA